MKKEKPKYQVILFNADEICCYTLENCQVTENRPQINVACLTDNYPKYIEGIAEISISGEFGRNKIELSPKQMRQIAKYNTERDIDFLIRKKKLLEEEIKLIENKKKIVENKFKELGKFANEFLNSSEKTVDDYIEEHYYDDSYDYDYDD